MLPLMLETFVPRYFFHVHDGHDFIDEVGTDFPSQTAARNHAAIFAGELLQSSPEIFWSGEKWRMHVVDHHGTIIFCLMFIGFDESALAAQADGADARKATLPHQPA